MRRHPTALLGSTLLLLGTLTITGCDDTQLPDAPGVEEQEDGGGQEDREGDDEE